MTISSYQVDAIIKAYNKQNRLKMKTSVQKDNRGDEYDGVATLSVGKGPSDATYKAISYNLLDIILNFKQR